MTSAARRAWSRRDVLGAIGTAAGAAVAGACGSSVTPVGPSTATTGSTASGTTTSTTSGACAIAPNETIGPYPDITGMLGNQAFFRQDVTEGRPGLPLSLVITVVNANAACAPLAGAAVEIWQCDADGHYSEYAQPGFNGSGQTFLRGLQVTDAAGRVTFKTVYPGWYQGRATHVHVEVYVNGRSIKVTQIAFPEDITAQVYRSGVYASHGQNPTTNRSDMVFSDGVSDELATLSGSVAGGYTASITFGVAA